MPELLRQWMTKQKSFIKRVERGKKIFHRQERQETPRKDMTENEIRKIVVDSAIKVHKILGQVDHGFVCGCLWLKQKFYTELKKG